MTTLGTTCRSLALTALLALISEPSAQASPDSPDFPDHTTPHADARKAFLAGVTPFVNAYCTECHSGRKP